MKLLFLLLISGSCLGQGSGTVTYSEQQKPESDTISVIILVCDTTRELINQAFWARAYEVRDKYCCVDGNTSNLAFYQPVPYYIHNHYLTMDKKRIAKKFLVWQSKPY